MFLDFTTMDNVNNWYEQSDTVRVPGKSKVFRARQSYRDQVLQTLTLYSGTHI